MKNNSIIDLVWELGDILSSKENISNSNMGYINIYNTNSLLKNQISDIWKLRDTYSSIKRIESYSNNMVIRLQ